MSFFPDPRRFSSQIVELIKSGPLTNFERFRYPRTFLKKFVKVRNLAKNFSEYATVGVGRKCVGGKLAPLRFF